mmetsp:Transcript_34384/g.25455  ORF Transcript_34384/g.25455 Transcript_34384/m.25455 type:complete len:213 (-) Transcript_34384:333-971(-)
MRTLAISLFMSSISTSFLEMSSKVCLVCFIKLADDFSMVFCWLAWFIMSSRKAFVFVCNCIILVSNTFIFSSTFDFSTSIRLDSESVDSNDCFNMWCFSASFFVSLRISSFLSFKNSYSALHLLSFSCSFSDVSCSFLVSFFTPVISLSTCKISSFFCLMSSLMAWSALSLCCMPNKDFCQSSSNVFLLMTIFSISMAASLSVFLAAAVSSF